MEIILYVIGFLVLLRYGFVLYKFLKTGEFKKRVSKKNIIGVIAYSFLTALIICFLILLVLVNKDKSNDLIMWIILAMGTGTVIMYPLSWMERASFNTTTKYNEIDKLIDDEFYNKYGKDLEKDIKLAYFKIEDNVIINEQFNYLISLITNNQISFIHPNKYKNIADAFADLYQQDYVKVIDEAESIHLTCEKVNDLLRKDNIDLEIKSQDITKSDNEFIKARRSDNVATILYDLNKIDEIIKEKTNGYELVLFKIYDSENSDKYPHYICIMEKSKYDEFFKSNNNKAEDINNE